QDGATAGAVFMNDGSGSFASSAARPLPVGLFGANKTLVLDEVAVDVNNDGFVDVICSETTGTYLGRRVQILVNDGAGNLVDDTAARFPLDKQGGSYPALFLHVDDYDGDGDKDLFLEVEFFYPIMPGPQPSDALLYLNDGNGRYTAAPDSFLPPRSKWHQLVP